MNVADRDPSSPAVEVANDPGASTHSSGAARELTTCPSDPFAAIQRPETPRSCAYCVRTVVRCALHVVLFLLGAEGATRLHDWVSLGVTPTQNTYSNEWLVLHSASGARGRPHAIYRKWSLNRYGFRGPEISPLPTPDRPRVMILGASEAFGLYESEGKEFPALLRRTLEESDRAEVINAAIAGMTVSSMSQSWDDWFSRFRPSFVLIYASPLFCLAGESPDVGRSLASPTGTGPAAAARSDDFSLRRILERSRLVARLRDALDVPGFIQRRRRDRWIAQAEAQHGPDWLFIEVPADRVENFARHLDNLLDAIMSKAARPILITHATRSSNPPTADDLLDLNAMRSILPRATPLTLVTFEDRCNNAIRELASARGIPLIDVAASVSGHRPLFVDLVHFNEHGAAEVASLIARELRPILAASVRSSTNDTPRPPAAPHSLGLSRSEARHPLRPVDRDAL